MDIDDYQTEARRTAPRELKAYPEAVRLAYEALRVQAVVEDDDRGTGAGNVTRLQAATLLTTLDSLIWGLGLTGEAGEVVDLLKKGFGHGHGVDREKLKKELGDVLWYLANLADAFGLTLSEVALVNVLKLRARYPTGFSVEASKAKADESDPAPVMRLGAPAEQVTKWADPDAAYQRVFNEPRVEKTMIPPAGERCVAKRMSTELCPGNAPCELHSCTRVYCGCIELGTTP